MKRRVVVTGLGAVTPLGNTVDETWAGIRAGKSGLGPITLFDASEYAVRIAAEVKNFETAPWLDRKEARKMARFCQFVTVAAAQAIADAGFTKETISAAKSGIMIGNGIGGFEVIEASMKKYFEAGPGRVPPLSVPMFISNEGAGNISMLYGIQGVSWTLATACASSTDSLGMALDLVRSGRMDVCVAGGAEASITGFGIGSFSVLQTLATSFNDNPQQASRPFDRDREGFIMGEGAGILILEGTRSTDLRRVRRLRRFERCVPYNQPESGRLRRRARNNPCARGRRGKAGGRAVLQCARDLHADQRSVGNADDQKSVRRSRIYHESVEYQKHDRSLCRRGRCDRSAHLRQGDLRRLLPADD